MTGDLRSGWVAVLLAALWTVATAADTDLDAAEAAWRDQSSAALEAYLEALGAAERAAATADDAAALADVQRRKTEAVDGAPAPPSNALTPWVVTRCDWGEYAKDDAIDLDVSHKARTSNVGLAIPANVVLLAPDPAPSRRKRLLMVLTNGQHAFELEVPEAGTSMGPFRVRIDALDEAGQSIGRPEIRVRTTGSVHTDGALPPTGYAKNVFRRNQVALRGIVVSETGAGLAGEVIDIIATVLPSDTRETRFERDVGKQMKSSLSEAVRTVRTEHPGWDGTQVRFSFQDKYSAKDGGSAGAAYAVALRALLEGFEVDRSFAMTGDITVDGRVRAIGGVAAKIRGAALDHADIVAIPAENADALGDVVVLESIRPLLETQIFALETLDEAVAVARSDRDKQLQAAIDGFRQIATVWKEGGERALGSDAVDALLTEVLESAPHHLSARRLREFLDGASPQKLSISGSLSRAITAGRPVFEIFEALEPRKRVTAVQRDAVAAARRDVRRIRPLIHADIQPFRMALERYIGEANRFVNASSPNQKLIKRLNQLGEEMVEEYRRLGRDADTLATLMRESQ